METSVKIIADSCNPVVASARIITFEVTAPRYLLAEINTHGVLAKSAASSRAIPVAKRLEMVRDNPYVPEEFYLNQAGMTAETVAGPLIQDAARALWDGAAKSAAMYQEAMGQLNIHKTQANRITEPYTYVKQVLTGTEWKNFFALRMHRDADPGFQILSTLMANAVLGSEPRQSLLHAPYVDELFKDLETTRKVSAARCARVSYKTFDGRVSTPEEDLELCDKLMSSGHWSPFDHVAHADFVYQCDNSDYHWVRPQEQGRFWGWVSYRTDLEKSLGIETRRSSFEPFKI